MLLDGRDSTTATITYDDYDAMSDDVSEDEVNNHDCHYDEEHGHPRCGSHCQYQFTIYDAYNSFNATTTVLLLLLPPPCYPTNSSQSPTPMSVVLYISAPFRARFRGVPYYFGDLTKDP